MPWGEQIYSHASKNGPKKNRHWDNPVANVSSCLNISNETGYLTKKTPVCVNSIKKSNNGTITRKTYNIQHSIKNTINSSKLTEPIKWGRCIWQYKNLYKHNKWKCIFINQVNTISKSETIICFIKCFIQITQLLISKQWVLYT